MASSNNPAITLRLASLVLSGLCVGAMNPVKAQVSEVECGRTAGRTPTVETENLVLVVRSPMFRINLDLEMQDWPDLSDALREFAETRRWTFRDASEVRPGTVQILHVELCADNGLRFRVSEQLWAWRGYASASPGHGLLMPLYGDVPDEVWQRAAADMVLWLETHWPDRIRFRDPDGYIIERPDFIDAYAQP